MVILKILGVINKIIKNHISIKTELNNYLMMI